MASYTFTHVLRFQDSDGNGSIEFIGTDTNPGGWTLSDGDDDDTFEEGDVVPFGEEFFPNITYAGTITVDAEKFPVFQQFGLYRVFMDREPVEIPSTFDLDEAGIFCFAKGTRIATPKGAVAVEVLAIGDLVLTVDGRSVPVTWIGRQTRAPRFQRLGLIRIAAGALGGGLPLRDLLVTADHALVIEGLLVNAGALVNGTTISEVRGLPERVTVYHIEAEAHDIILAEGTPAETYIDYAGRRVFDNYAEYVALYGEEWGIVENPAPRVTCARMLPPALKAQLGISLAA